MAKLNSGTRIYGNLTVDTWANVASATVNNTLIVGTVTAATIGNTSANVVGIGTYLTALSATSISGTNSTANVSLYDSVTAYTTVANFYPQFSNISTTGNSVTGVATNMVFNPGTGNLYVDNFVGSGQYLTGITATVAGTVATANVALYDSVTAYTTNQTFYPQFSNISTTGNSVTGVSSNLSFNPATGNLNISGNLNVTSGNILVGTALNFTPLNAPVRAGFNINSYSQVLLQNTNAGNNASTDIAAVANNGSDLDTYIDMGMLSSTYSQPGYSIYYPNDGYVVVAGNATTKGGNLVLTTTLTNDIIFATGGQNTNNEVMRVTSGNVLNIKSTVISSNTASGALVVAGGAGVVGNLNVGGTVNSFSGNVGIRTTTPDTELTILGIPQTVVYSITGVNLTSGTDLHIVGADGAVPTRITQDTFGTGSYIAFTGRSARGTAASPAQSLPGDTLAQFTGRGFSSGSLGFGVSSSGRVDIVAAGNFTDTSRATNVVVYTTAVDAINPTAVATFSSATGLAVTGNIIANGSPVPVLGLSIVSAQGWNLA
jgi:hypothetical protein